MITDINQLDLTKRYTYADYLTWQFDEVVELIRGKVVRRMSPAPNRSHQEISSNLLRCIFQLTKDSCKVFHAPFDVRLPLPLEKQHDQKISTVVQPDICVICDLDKLDERGCNGAPNWIIEILSKSTAQKDLTEKFSLYEHAGVQEYWIVHPSEGTVLPYRLDDKGQYQLLRQTPFTTGEQLPVRVFNDLTLDLKDVFE